MIICAAMLASTNMSEQPQVSFVAFLMSLATTAAVHFGDLPDPVTNQASVSLEGARQMIDILAMLQEKTRGNLTDDEAKLLDDLLYDLRMRFVEASTGGGEAPRIIVP